MMNAYWNQTVWLSRESIHFDRVRHRPSKGFPCARLSHMDICAVPDVCFITRRITSDLLFYTTYYVFSPDWFVKSGRIRFLIRVLPAKPTFTYIIEKKGSSSDRTRILPVVIQAGELSDDTVTQL